MMQQAYHGLGNMVYTPGQKIGQGGEGTVFEVAGEPTLVVKIYTEAIDADKAAKLIFMVSLVCPDLLKYAAWPLDVVMDKEGEACGLIMNKLQAYVPLHNLFNPMDRKKLFPDKGYNFLIHVARNLAIAFSNMHRLGIIMGDVNEANILINPKGYVSLIDCDSFQIKKDNQYYFCEVGIPRYTPPELLERGSFTNVIRTEHTDNFSLATLIFQLLFLGRAPFTGVNPNHQEIDEATAIRTKEFAYSLHNPVKKLFPAKNSLELKSLSTGVVQLFHAAFEETPIRPSAIQWTQELELLSKDIIQCTVSRLHYYPMTMGKCPWCLFKEKANIIYFLDDSYLTAMPELHNMEQFVNGFKLDKIEIKRLTENFPKPLLSAHPIDRKFYALRNIRWFVIVSIAIIALVLAVVFTAGIATVGVLAIFLFNKRFPIKKQLKRELEARQIAYDAHRLSFQALVKQYNNPPTLNQYNKLATRLGALIKAFQRLPDDFMADKKEIEESHYNGKYLLYLQQFDIRDYTIPTFGAAKKLLLYSNGIQKAADISKLSSIKIAGIGPKNIQILLDWQRQMGSGFTYTPDVNTINYEISIAAREIADRRRQLETEIKAAYKNVQLLRTNILSTAQTLEHKYDERSKQFYQAELDLNAFRRLVK
jgi:DNA-binding helix-hairpin-helix protein with protein kinase domain